MLLVHLLMQKELTPLQMAQSHTQKAIALLPTVNLLTPRACIRQQMAILHTRKEGIPRQMAIFRMRKATKALPAESIRMRKAMEAIPVESIRMRKVRIRQRVAERLMLKGGTAKLLPTTLTQRERGLKQAALIHMSAANITLRIPKVSSL